MDEAATKGDRVEARKKARVGKRIVPWLMLVLVIALTVGLFVFTQRYPERVKELAALGYLGVGIVSLVSSASIILPVPGVLVVFPLVTALNPVLLALAASTGGIFGEISGYMAGYGGRGVVHRTGIHARAEGWIRRWGVWTILFFAAVPLIPFDIAGLLAGALRYPLWKFMLVGWVGKSVKFIVLALAAHWGLEFLLRFFG